MNATTQSLIDKIKRSGLYGTDTDEMIAAKIMDALDDINTDTSSAYSVVDETDYEVTPSIAGTDNSPYRLAIYYKVKSVYLTNKKNEANNKAVRVKSGRDEVDTTKAIGGYEKSLEEANADYWNAINRINQTSSTSTVGTEDDE